MSDVVAEDRLSGAERATLGDWSSCIAGALSVQEYEAGLLAAGFVDVSVAFTHESPTACTGRSSEHPSP